MIYRLQRKLILICTVSVLAVVLLVFCVILALNVSNLNRNMDILADSVSEGGGIFPTPFGDDRTDGFFFQNEPNFNFITPETPFSTRHFTVLFDKNGNVLNTFTESIYSISETQAVEYARTVLNGNRERGWLEQYRYKVFSGNMFSGVVFVDGSMNRSATLQSLTISGTVLLSCAALVIVLVFLLSKKAVKPIAESYEKQKQFVTDANHELKTPLTLILANLDIAESELGKNEWLDDIRSEGHRMNGLVNQLVALSRMDEEKHRLNYADVVFGNLLWEAVIEFQLLAKDAGKTVTAYIDKTVTVRGDEEMLQRLVYILLDNAVKYCDPGGEIKVKLDGGRRITLAVENTYASVGEIELNRLFDRFYRADKARKFTGGYGIGLSMAKAIAEKHKGEITAYKRNDTNIGFKLTLHS